MPFNADTDLPSFLGLDFGDTISFVGGPTTQGIVDNEGIHALAHEGLGEVIGNVRSVLVMSSVVASVVQGAAVNITTGDFAGAYTVRDIRKTSLDGRLTRVYLMDASP